MQNILTHVFGITDSYKNNNNENQKSLNQCFFKSLKETCKIVQACHSVEVLIKGQ